MKTINTISDTLGYTIDTYGQFNPDGWLDDDEKLGEYGTDWDFDHTAYVASLSNFCAEELERHASFAKFNAKFTTTSSYSPREYNFKTDNAELMIEFDDKTVMQYIRKHADEFKLMLKDRFTSYNGFMSFVPNNWPEFMAEAGGDSVVDADRDWAIMLGWYLQREVLSEDDYIDAMNDYASEAAYNSVTDVEATK